MVTSMMVSGLAAAGIESMARRQTASPGSVPTAGTASQDTGATFWAGWGSGDTTRAFLSAGTRLSIASTGAGAFNTAAVALGQAKVPMTSDGFPNFDAIVAAGGTVKGAIPPDGSPMVQNVNQHGNVTQYAAIVDLGDGSPPFLLKGGDAIAATATSAKNRHDLLSILHNLLAELPANLEQARAWSNANHWPTYDGATLTGPAARLDATA